jgi:hypothetical protein
MPLTDAIPARKHYRFFGIAIGDVGLGVFWPKRRADRAPTTPVGQPELPFSRPERTDDAV